MMANPPKCLTIKLIENALRLYSKDSQLTISSLSFSPGSQQGDNYSSLVFRAKFRVSSKGKNCVKSVIIKTMPVWDKAVEFVTKCRSFEKEAMMLGEVLPEMQKILETIGYTEPIGPILYFGSLKPNKIIITKDLGQEGFVVPDRIKGLSLEQCTATVEKLAMFHAASLVFFEHKPYARKIFQENGQWGFSAQETTSELLTKCFEYILENVDSWSNYKWSSKLAPIFEKLPDRMYEIYDNKDPKFPLVLIHGDIWTSNIMLKTFQDSCKIRFLDFQICYEQSPVIDLMHLIFTSPHREIRFNKIEIILKTYYETFRNATNRLRIKINYSYDDMLCDFKSKLVFGFCIFSSLHAVFSKPRTCCDNEEGQNIKEILRNPQFHQSFLEGLPYFERMNLF